MAFVLKKAKKIKEDLLLVDDNGMEQLIEVNLDIDDFLPRFYAARKNLNAAQAELKESANEEEKLERLGVAIVALFDVIFGKENTKKILDFYDEKYTKMLTEISPFLVEVIYPRINQAANEKIQQIKQLHKKIK